MKIFFYMLIIFVSASIGCCTKHEVIQQTTSVVLPAGTTLGKVSHQYRKTGCSTVIIVSKDGQQDLTLIPVDTLQKEFDSDGLEIFFNYRMLKIKNPIGCSVGIPATITDISKK